MVAQYGLSKTYKCRRNGVNKITPFFMLHIGHDFSWTALFNGHRGKEFSQHKLHACPPITNGLNRAIGYRCGAIPSDLSATMVA
jgi:hypothetical protein